MKQVEISQDTNGATHSTKSFRDTELPDWIDETPEECSYELTMFEGIGGQVQQIDITRDEYLHLKKHLAKMRGYRTPRRHNQHAGKGLNEPILHASPNSIN